MAAVVEKSAPIRRRASRRVFVPIAIVCFVIALVGFWPTYFGPLLAGSSHALPIIHLHAAVFMGWVSLLIAQALLAATGRLSLHMKVGKFGMLWGLVVIVVGWATAFSRFADRVQAGNLEEAQIRLIAPFTDLLFFAPLLAAAWHYRLKPEIHKRLIIVASTVLLIAAVHRMTFLGGRPPPVPQLLAVWLSPIILGMIHDFLKKRLVHIVYLLGIAIVLLMKFGRAWINDTDAWRQFTNLLAAFYG